MQKNKFDQIVSVSAIICTYNRSKWVNKLLKSLSEQTLIPHEIFIVDASKAEMNYNFTTNLNIKLIKSDIMALTYQRNLGVSNSRGNIILMLDDDVVLHKNFVEKIIAPFNDKNYKNIGAVSGFDMLGWGNYGANDNWAFKLAKRLNIYDGNFEPGSISPSGICIELNWLKPFKGIKKVDFYSGCSTAIKAQVYKKYRHPESINKYGGEDKIFSALISQDWDIYICGDAKLEHHTAPGGARQGPYENGKNIIRFNSFLHYIFNKNENYLRLRLYYSYLSLINFIFSFYTFLIKRDLKQSKYLIYRSFGFLSGLYNLNQMKIKIDEQ